MGSAVLYDHSKEEMMGLLAAVERYLSLDHEQLFKTYEARLTIGSMNSNGLSRNRLMVTSEIYPNELVEPVASVLKVDTPTNHTTKIMFSGCY